MTRAGAAAQCLRRLSAERLGPGSSGEYEVLTGINRPWFGPGEPDLEWVFGAVPRSQCGGGVGAGALGRWGAAAPRFKRTGFRAEKAGNGGPTLGRRLGEFGRTKTSPVVYSGFNINAFGSAYFLLRVSRLVTYFS